MISAELESKILRLHHAEKWRVGTIARQLGIHHSTARRVLSQAGLPAGRRMDRPSMVDPFVPFILETLGKYPTLPASRLHAMVVERGYPGGPDYFRAVVARFRPRKPAEAYLKLRTLPGEEGQVDWAHFGTHEVGRAKRRLSAFVMVLSWCRAIFVKFYWDQQMPSFLSGHVAAFSHFGGVPRRLLYDNLKSAVLERHGDAIRFHPTLLELASHYRYEPRPVAIRRGNEKGRVERAIRYLRTSFFPARTWSSIEDLNTQVLAWCNGPAAERRCPEDRAMTVREAAEVERTRLMSLPDDVFPAEARTEIRVGRQPYIRFDRNEYSVPHDRVRRTLVVRATPERLRIMDGNDVVAHHARTFDSGTVIEDPAHVAALVEWKHAAREARGKDRLHHAAPRSEALFAALAERGSNLGAATNGLNRLLDEYGAAELDAAIGEALDRHTAHLAAVRQILDRRRRQRNMPPPISLPVPEHPRLNGLVLRPHALENYDPTPEREDIDDTQH